jgi:hypothetical protein
LEPSQDQGSIMLAITIIFVLILVVAAVASATIGNMGNVLSRQQITQAVAAANGGISDALFRLDQGTAGISADGTTPPSYFCVNSANSSDSNCLAHSVPGVSGASQVSYVATPDNAANATTWTIKSVGTVGKQQAAVQETTSRVRLYPWTLFAVNALSIDGQSGGNGQGSDFSTYSETGSGVNPNGALQIGTDGTLKCTGGGLPSNVTADYYSGNGSGNQASCGSPVGTQVSFPAPNAPASTPNCPYNGDIPANTTLSPGTYYCNTPVTIEGNLNVSGQVKLYIILSGSSYSNATNALNIKGTYINDMYDYCKNGGTTGCPTSGMPVASNLQIFTNSTGTLGNSNGNGYYFGGTIYAPLATTTADGCHSQYYGSVILYSFTCNGAPNFSFNYDSNLANYFGTWLPGTYQQIPPGPVVAAIP